VDLVERAGDLKGELIEFALSPRFDRELSAVVAESFPGGLVTDEAMFSMVLDHFPLQYRLRSGSTVVEAFVAAHPELTDTERDMLLGWREVVGGIFDVIGKDQHGHRVRGPQPRMAGGYPRPPGQGPRPRGTRHPHHRTPLKQAPLASLATARGEEARQIHVLCVSPVLLYLLALIAHAQAVVRRAQPGAGSRESC
jgi:hypothetical protein